MSYDPKCERLARYFLVDPDPDIGVQPTPMNVRKLAQVIQDAIEDWLGEQEQDAREREEGSS